MQLKVTIEDKEVSGYGNGNFGPKDLITRQEMAMMLNNFIKAIGLRLESEKAEMELNMQDSESKSLGVNNSIPKLLLNFYY